MDEIGQQHDLLQHDLQQESNEIEKHPLFSQISEWEQESIIKIQVTAELARADLRQQFEAKNSRLKSDFGQLSRQIRTGRDSYYSENDLTHWMGELRKMRQKFEKPSTNFKITCDSEIAAVHFIKIIDDNDNNYVSENIPTVAVQQRININPFSPGFHDSIIDTSGCNTERFETVAGDAKLTENKLIATKSSIYSASIRGAYFYTTGIHQRRFRIEHLSNKSIFIGIISSTQSMTTTAFKLSSVYGWWDTNFPVLGGIHNANGIYSMRTGDEVILTLACDERKLIYHNGKCGSNTISVDHHFCPFPWQVLVVVGAGENMIRILS